MVIKIQMHQQEIFIVTGTTMFYELAAILWLPCPNEHFTTTFFY